MIKRLLILSAISGVLSYLSVSMPHFLASRFDVSDDFLFFLPGVLFAVFILMPLASNSRHVVLRWVGLLLFSVGAWYFAASIGIQVLPLVNQTPLLSCGISGSIGVLILALASRYLVPVRFGASSVAAACLAGFLGGCIIGMAVMQPRASLTGDSLYFIGFLFWHSSVALTLFGRLKRPAGVGK